MTRNFQITDARGGAAFTVRIITRANRCEIAGLQEDGSLKIRLTESPASSDQANAQLIEFLAQRLEVDPHQIEIVAGYNDKDKIISVEGINPGHLEQRLQPDSHDDAD